MLDEADGKDWKKFYDALKLLYPGCEGDRRYTRNDLDNLCAEQARIPIRTRDEFGTYYRNFLKISKFLITKKKLAELERDKLFLDGIHETTNAIIRRRLEIKMVDHHPDEPYPIDQVYTAAVFLLPGTAPVVSTSASFSSPAQPTYRTVIAPTPVAQPSVTVTQPSGGIVVKKEYSLQSTPYECYFCGGKSHIAKWCSSRREYITSGKIIENEGKVYMPDGSRIPGSREDGSFKDRIDKYTGQTPATGANAIQVQAGVYYRAAPDIEVIAEIDSSAFLHTCSETMEDEEEQEHLDKIRQVNAEYAAFTAERARRSNKGKTARFEGVDVPPRPKPGPSSKVTEQTEEIVSPEVREAKTKKAPNPGTVVVKPATKPFATDPAVPIASSSTTPAPQYRYAFPLEDKDAEKRVMDRILDTDVNVPIRDLIASSSDIRKALKDLTTSKRVTVGTVSVNELSGHPQTEQFLKGWDEHMKRANDGRIVADHFKSLRTIRGTTTGGRVLTCVLDQGAEVIVMPQSVWRSLGGVPLRSDYQMTMESVNTSSDQTLGVMENFPIDFGAGEMLFQVQIVPVAAFDVLLGRPFFTLTSCKTVDLPNGDQDITLTDPNSGKVIRIPMEPWMKKCPKCKHGMLCTDHPMPKGF